MATVNIGSLKFNWKGAYNGSTAYAVDDVTEYNGSSYICILASTGNLPTNTTYFQPMATKGTDGTDVGTTLTTQGDILYRDGSGLQRLAAGTAGQALITNGTGANPSWGSAGGIKQVIQDVKTDYTVSNSAGYIPNLEVTITPSSTSSKILIDTRLSLTGQHGDGAGAELQRSIGGGSYSAIGQADSAGSRQRSSFSGSAYTGDGAGEDAMQVPVNGIYLDSPNTTSAITYKVYYKIAGSNYLGINIPCSSGGTIQGNSADALVMTSSMTCYEITV